MEANQASIQQLTSISERLGAALSEAENEDDVFTKSCHVLGELSRGAAAVLLPVKNSTKYRVVYSSAPSSSIEEVERVTGISWDYFRVDIDKSPTFTRVVKEGKTILSPVAELLEEFFVLQVTSLIEKLWVTPYDRVIAGPLYPGGILVAFGPHYSEETLPAVRTLLRQISTFLQLIKLRLMYRQLEESLAHEHKLLHALMENIPDTIYFKDRHSRFIRCNRAQAQLVGISDPMEIAGKTDFDFFPKEMASRFFSDEQNLFKTGKPIIDQEEPVKEAGEKQIWVSTTKVPLFTNEGAVDGLVGISRHITQRKKAEEEKVRLEEQLTQSQKLESLGQLAGGIAHDFNNMLGAIMGYAYMIQRRAAGSDQIIQNHARIIIEASRRASDLTGKLLAFARKGKYQVVVVNVHETIQDVIKLLTHTIDPRITIRQHLTADPATVMGDRAQLQNAILNLAVNARDAMPKGGELVFGTDVITIPDRNLHEYPHLASAGKYLILSVTDTGMGMDEETKEHIFEPFFTTKEKGHGTGLGLASVYGTVKSHQGAIEVSTKRNKGTRFEVFLPLVEIEEKESTQEEERLQKGSGTIMIVDDEELIRDMAAEMLQHLGYDAIPCKDGQEAVEYYRKNNEKVDLIIVDMIMPRMGGVDCVTEIRKINPDARVIISTGYSLVRDSQKIMAKGVDGFIQKPFEEQELSHLIAQVLRG
ncbi:MAG: response regulator [Chitinispirillaceae bacterium]|nr:response regulator [Chitinispirillaceae bacterium]